MPTLHHVEFHHPFTDDARATHNLILTPCTQPESRTLYHLHGIRTTRVTVQTDDAHYNPEKWGKRVKSHRQEPCKYDVQVGQQYEFRIRLNRIKRDSQTKKTVSFTTEDELDTFFQRLADRAGFMPLEFQSAFEPGMRLDSKIINIPTAHMQGRLKVTDAALLNQALLQGMGRAKRFGCGLLLIRPA